MHVSRHGHVKYASLFLVLLETRSYPRLFSYASLATMVETGKLRSCGYEWRGGELFHSFRPEQCLVNLVEPIAELAKVSGLVSCYGKTTSSS